MARFPRIAAAITAAVLLLALVSSQALALARPDDGGFTITNDDVSVVISGDNSYAVTETISVNFSEPRHGIYRDIPLSGAVFRTSGGEGRFKAAISEVAVEGVPFDTSESDGIASIRIGSAGSTVTGPQTYRLSYRLQFADDGEAGFDEVYLNLIGNGWSTEIQKATFSVTLPASIDRNAVGFSMGHFEESGYALSDLEYSVDGNTIRGETLRALEANEGLTLRVELPQGTFTLAGAAQPEVVLPDQPANEAAEPIQWAEDGPKVTAGRVGLFGLLLGGGAVVAILAIIAVVVLIVVLAVRHYGGFSGTARLQSGFAQDEQWRMNQMNQLNHMHQMDQMNQMNQMNQPDTTPTDFGSFSGGDSGGSTGGGGSW